LVWEKYYGKPVNPANKNLLNVEPGSKELGKEKSDVFHSIVAKLLCVCKRGGPDVETAVSYLCKQV